jgi:hypothetical protein
VCACKYPPPTVLIFSILMCTFDFTINSAPSAHLAATGVHSVVSVMQPTRCKWESSAKRNTQITQSDRASDTALARVPKHYICSVSGLGRVQEYFPTFRKLLLSLSPWQTNLGVSWEPKRSSGSGPCEAGRWSDRALSAHLSIHQFVFSLSLSAH